MKKIFLFCSLVLLLVGCGEGFLDTEPLTMKVNTNFYQTPAEVDQALIGIYSAVSPEDIPSWSFMVSEFMSGDRLPGGSPDDAHATAMGQFENFGEDLYLPFWERQYQGIFRANMLLKAMDENPEVFPNEQDANKAKGQARFLRAYFYLELAKMFGTVPLHLDPTGENLPKAGVDELYGQIAADLKFAIENLPSVPLTPNDFGRTTKWAAEGYMARAFLFYTGVYNKESLPLAGGGSVTKDQVISYVDDCIANSGRVLVPDFRNLWPYSYVNKDYGYAKDNNLSWVGEEGGNTEVIFSIRHSNAGNWSYMPASNQLVLFLGWKDQQQIPFGQGWGWQPVSTTLWDVWPDEDLRKRGSVQDVNDMTEMSGTTGYIWGLDNQLHDTGLWQKKYRPVNHYVNGKIEPIGVKLYGANAYYQLCSFQEIVLLRFADVLLMGAELGSAKKQEYMDRVRSRVKLPSIPVTLENIKNERRFELAFEGIRYYDLLRWGDVEKEVNKIKDIPVKNSNVPGTYSTKYRPETKGFLPIPNSQILLSNGVLTQNEGW